MPQRTAAPEALAAWLRAQLDELEAGLRPPEREATLERLAAYHAERQAEVRWWLGARSPGRTRGAEA